MYHQTRLLSLFILAIPAFFTGCGHFHEYRTMRVLVRDAETKQPRSDVEIVGRNNAMFDVFGPRPPRGITGPDGVATLQIGQTRSFILRAQQVGYVMTDVREGLTAEFVKQLPKNGHRGARDVDYVIDVPPDPGPTFQLVIPDNYCGLLRIRFESVEEVAVASQRVYTLEVGVDGRAVVRLPNASRNARDGRNIAAREKSWKPIRWECDSNSERIGLRHVHHTEVTELYLIGTGAEAEAMHQKLHPVRESGKREFDPVAYEKLFDK